MPQARLGCPGGVDATVDVRDYLYHFYFFTIERDFNA
jgi:hypothetical protein